MEPLEDRLSCLQGATCVAIVYISQNKVCHIESVLERTGYVGAVSIFLY